MNCSRSIKPGLGSASSGRWEPVRASASPGQSGAMAGTGWSPARTGWRERARGETICVAQVTSLSKRCSVGCLVSITGVIPGPTLGWVSPHLADLTQPATHLVIFSALPPALQLCGGEWCAGLIVCIGDRVRLGRGGTNKRGSHLAPQSGLSCQGELVSIFNV